MTHKYDVIIIGAGAAGLMSAIEAGKRGRRVLLIDHSKKIGEKIRISGGGRCNFTNINTHPNKFTWMNINVSKVTSSTTRYTNFFTYFFAWSIKSTFRPRLPASIALIMPAAPAPTIITSYFSVID